MRLKVKNKGSYFFAYIYHQYSISVPSGVVVLLGTYIGNTSWELQFRNVGGSQKIYSVSVKVSGTSPNGRRFSVPGEHNRQYIF